MRILGIETSCDETAAAVLEAEGSGTLRLLSNVVASSVDLHAAYGGVVPEIAARSHLEYINPVIDKALSDANTSWDQINFIAVAKGPGLGGSLLVGVLTARTLAILHNKPLFGINHVEAHPYAAFLEYKLKFPLLALIVSGGHSHLVLFENHLNYKVLGQTLDDAVGEAFDKVAKILGLPYPGGPNIEKAAEEGDASRYAFPKARLKNPYDFSFSGLKTAVLRAAQQEIGEDHSFPSYQIAKRLNQRQRHDIAASFQAAALTALSDVLEKAYSEFFPKSVVVAGGVAANRPLRGILDKSLETSIVYPDIKLCTDNGAMIAARAAYKIAAGVKPESPYTLEATPDLKM